MNPTPHDPQCPPDANEEVSALVAGLRKTGQRPEELSAGEVDSAADADGRTFLLRGVHQQLRDANDTEQAAILNALPANIALLDSQGIIVSVNEAWRRFGGANALHSPGHAVGVNYLEICDSARGNDAVEGREAAGGIRSVLRGAARSFELEYPCDSPTEKRWFLMTVTPLSDDRRGGAVVMHLNITERRRAEVALRESEQRFSGAFEHASVGVALVSPAGHWLKVNQALCELVGYSEAELLTRTFQDITYPEDLESDLDNVRRLLAGDIRTYQMEKRYIHKLGHLVTVLLNVSLVRDDAGQPLYFISQIQNITARKAAEDALRASEAEFRTLAESMPQIVWIARPDGWNIYFNQQWMDYTGLTLADSAGHGWYKPFHPDDQQRARDAWQKATETAGLYSIECRLRRADGIYRWWLVRGTPLQGADRKIRKWFGTCTDIHDMKVAELNIAHSNQQLRNSETSVMRLNRVYAMLSGINTLIVRVHDREELYREACRIAVETGGFRMAMIAIVDRSTKKIVPVASAGKDDALLAAIKRILSSDEDASKTMVARAIKEKKAVVSNESHGDAQVVFGESYAMSGVNSLAVLPLIIDEEAVGVLALYVSESNFFHEDELKLVTELANDIAFTMGTVDRQERLNYLAYYDVLTGLANRTLIHERLEQSIANASEHGRKVALVLLDIERFKTINDTLGRSVGDTLLKAVAARMMKDAAETGRLARIEADHFAVIVSEVETEEGLARHIEQRIATIFGPPFRIDDADLRIAGKVGIAVFPVDGADAATLFRNAEAALDGAKASGERYLFYTRTMNERVAGKLAMENQLREALEKEEFVLHYQPKVNLASGKITGAEALIRWNDPRTGLVPPGQFIPILEETGLIVEVGRWALKKAIADYLRWRAAGLPAVRIAVNVSPLQLRNRRIIAEIERAIGIDARAPAGLELEITESLIMADVKNSIASLLAIRAMGVTIAIDDFGTGFSSLSYLAKLPVHTLKIDRSFVIDMTAGPQGLSLVSTIVNLAHSLKLKVVAEGVETEEQSRLLRLLGCDEMQGYLFSRPVPGEVFETRYLAAPAVV